MKLLKKQNIYSNIIVKASTPKQFLFKGKESDYLSLSKSTTRQPLYKKAWDLLFINATPQSREAFFKQVRLGALALVSVSGLIILNMRESAHPNRTTLKNHNIIPKIIKNNQKIPLETSHELLTQLNSSSTKHEAENKIISRLKNLIHEGKTNSADYNDLLNGLQNHHDSFIRTKALKELGVDTPDSILISLFQDWGSWNEAHEHIKSYPSKIYLQKIKLGLANIPELRLENLFDNIPDTHRIQVYKMALEDPQPHVRQRAEEYLKSKASEEDIELLINSINDPGSAIHQTLTSLKGTQRVNYLHGRDFHTLNNSERTELLNKIRSIPSYDRAAILEKACAYPELHAAIIQKLHLAASYRTIELLNKICENRNASKETLLSLVDYVPPHISEVFNLFKNIFKHGKADASVQLKLIENSHLISFKEVDFLENAGRHGNDDSIKLRALSKRIKISHSYTREADAKRLLQDHTIKDSVKTALLDALLITDHNNYNFLGNLSETEKIDICNSCRSSFSTQIRNKAAEILKKLVNVPFPSLVNRVKSSYRKEKEILEILKNEDIDLVSRKRLLDALLQTNRMHPDYLGDISNQEKRRICTEALSRYNVRNAEVQDKAEEVLNKLPSEASSSTRATSSNTKKPWEKTPWQNPVDHADYLKKETFDKLFQDVPQGNDNEASWNNLKKNYRKLSLELHPDRLQATLKQEQPNLTPTELQKHTDIYKIAFQNMGNLYNEAREKFGH